MTTEQKTRFEKVIDLIRPEAKEFVDSVMKDNFKTTKDNYGKVMSFLGSMTDTQMAQIFLLAMIKEGYPTGTANQIRQIMGWT